MTDSTPIETPVISSKPLQLRMVWPQDRLHALPDPQVHPDYELRFYQPGDETAWYTVMALAGFTGWNQERVDALLQSVLQDGWFLAYHRATGELAASAIACHQPHALHPFGGALNWVAGHPAHQGKGLGWSVCAAVTARLLRAGYKNIYLLTDDWRLPAVKIYLKLGYQPFLFAPDMQARWEAVCAQLNWPFTPEVWPRAGAD